MHNIFEERVDSMLEKWQLIAQTHQTLLVKSFVDPCYMEILLQTHFGIKIDNTNDSNNIILKNIEKLTSVEISFSRILSVACPAISNFFGIRFVSRNATDYMTCLINKIIDQRKQQNFSQNDFIQYFIDEESKNQNQNTVHNKSE